MRRQRRSGILALLVVLSAGELRAQIEVAVEDGSPDGTGADLVAQLNDDTYFDFQATLVTAAGIDSPAELAAFDVVILGGSGINNADWTDAMAGALLAWVQGGGGAILTGWGNLEFDNVPAGAAADLDALFPTPNSLSINDWTLSSETLDFIAAHPVVDGIPDFSLGALANECCIELNDVGAEPDDLVLATMPSGTFPGDGIAVAVKPTVGLGCSVYLGPIFFGSLQQYPDVVPLLRSGLPDQLLEQAAAWAGGCAGAVAGPLAIPALSWVGLLGLAALLALAGTLALRRA